MALISAIFSLLSRKLGDLLQALFGWSIRGLFGRLPSKKETALSLALILSILWPVLIVGTVFPEVAAWLVAFIPLHEWLGDTVLRVVWIVLAVVSPILVGLITSWVAPSRTQRSVLRTVLAGYPLTLGMFISFLLTFFIVPTLKLIAMARRWQDEHVYVQVKERGYKQVLQHLAAACESAKVKVQDQPVPAVMRAPLRVLKWFARSGIEPVIASDPRMLRGDGIEVYLYPTDVLLRGVPDRTRRVRAAMVREMMQAPAYLTQDPKAQKLEEQLDRTWQMIARHGGVEEIRGNLQTRLRDLVKELDEANVPYDDWVLLYTHLQRLDREVSGDSALSEPASPPVKENIMPALDPRPEISTVLLLQQTVEEAKALLKTEIALAKNEAHTQIAAAKRVGVAAGAALMMALLGLSTLLVALVLFLGATPLVAALIGGGLISAAIAAGIIGYVSLPKKPLEQTQERLQEDAHILKERLV